MKNTLKISLKPNEKIYLNGAVIRVDRKVTLDLTDAARSWLGRVGYDPVYGARPLKRAVQKYLQDPLADLILKGEVKDGSTVKVDEGDGALALTPG